MTGLPELGSPTNGEAGLRKWTTDVLSKVKTWSRTLVAGNIPIKESVALPYRNVQDALEGIVGGALSAGSDSITNESDVTGATVSDALEALEDAIEALDSDDIANASGVAGATVSDALDALDAGGGGVTVPTVNPIRMSRIQGRWARGDRKWNVAAHIQDNLTTYEYGGVWYQICVFVNEDLDPVIAQRVLPGQSVSSAWTTEDLNGISGDPFELPFDDDSHNTIDVGVDSDGYIHIAANHHNYALRYVRSDSPNDIGGGWTEIGMTGSNETSVTYPAFVKTRDGTLLFFYRDGGSGDGDVLLNKYDPVTETWSALHHPLIDGVSSGANPYLNHIAVDDAGVIHIAWCWRHDSDPDTNEDIYYAKSANNGTSWTTAAGTAQTVPITIANGEKAIDIPQGSGLINQCGMECTSDGVPHIAFTMKDGDDVTQLHHLWYDGGWDSAQISEWSRGLALGSSTSDGAIMRPFVFAVGTRVYFGFAHKFVSRRGSVRCFEVTPGITEYKEFRLLDLDPGEGEVTFDTQALYERNVLSFLFHTATNGPPVTQNTDSWTHQIPLVFTYDLNYFDWIQSGMVRIPRIEPLLSADLQSVGSATSITSSTYTSTGPKIALTAENVEMGYVFVRHDVRGLSSQDAEFLYVAIEEDNDEGADTATYGVLVIPYEYTNDNDTLEVGTITVGSPWMPVRYTNYLWEMWEDPDAIILPGGTLNGRARVDVNTESATVNIHNIQLGILRHEGPA